MIVDDHPLFREGLKVIIAQDVNFEVVGEASTGHKGLQMARELRPDVALVDISLPDQSGIRLTLEIRRLLPETRVMIVSIYSKITCVSEAFRAGATGYVVKESAADRLLEGLASVARGQFFIDSALSAEVANQLAASPSRDVIIKDAAYGSLTPREQEIMRLLAEGFSTKEIGEKLFISPKTVENHRANLMNKLDLQGTVELVRYAAKLGLIDVDLWKD